MSIDPVSMGLPMMDAAQHSSAAEDIRRKDLKEAAQQFESYMTTVLIQEMRKTVPEGLFTSNAMDTFAGILDQEISARISSSGQIGLAEQLLGGLSGEQGGSADGLHPSLLLAEQGISRPGAFEAYGARRDGLEGPTRRGHLPVHGRLSSRYGWRTHPIGGHRQHHEGIDIAAAKGTRIDAVRGGKVTFSGEAQGYGNLLVIDHGNGLTSRYAHCDELNVQVGDRVHSGQGVATVGSTGRSTGPHLHFEVRQNGESIDPQEFFGWQK
jgi:murein DD-endopeptidase MepM/ murein hydrolase activator NlpD